MTGIQTTEYSDMATKQLFVFCLFSLALTLSFTNGEPLPSFDKSSFPANFVFGAGSAAYQSEGSPLKYGRGPCIWDEFVKVSPDKIADVSNGDVTDDFYHRFKEDIKLAKEVGLDSFRLSISWSRVLPKGKISGGVNPIGVKFYNEVFDEILAHGLKPFVTLLHFDTPQALEEEYGGLLSSKIVDDFTDYANFCFKTFGDRVKHWVTVNEPNIFTMFGYASGALAPGRCSSYDGNCTAGNSATEPYIVGHHLLLLHAAGSRLYKDKYQAKQKGKIGITVAVTWYLPLHETDADRLAVSRALDFYFGWFIHPVTYGDYPQSMRKLVGSRLPKFTPKQSQMLKSSLDYLTVNYYSSYYAYSVPSTNGVNLSYNTDGQFSSTGERNGVFIGDQTASPAFIVYPKGLHSVLVYLKKSYNNPTIYVTENGYAGNGSLPLKMALNDGARISFMKSHLSYLLEAIKDGVNVKGYYVWSLLDDWEWNSGYTIQFGLVYRDFTTQKRYLKDSAYWFKKFLLA